MRLTERYSCTALLQTKQRAFEASFLDFYIPVHLIESFRKGQNCCQCFVRCSSFHSALFLSHTLLGFCLISDLREKFHVGHTKRVGTVRHIRSTGDTDVCAHQNEQLFNDGDGRQHLDSRRRILHQMRDLLFGKNQRNHRILDAWHSGRRTFSKTYFSHRFNMILSFLQYSMQRCG